MTEETDFHPTGSVGGASLPVMFPDGIPSRLRRRSALFRAPHIITMGEGACF